MKEKIFNNLSLKLLSVLFAIVLWVVIINIYDPTTSKTLSSVTVQLVNTQELTDKNYTYEVVDGSKISVYISGPSSVITDITSSDIVATADLGRISAFANYVDIDVKVVKNGREITNVDVSPRTTAVILNIENRVTKDFPLKTETEGNVASGYVISDLVLKESTIRITGLASAVDNISKVAAVCNIAGATDDISGMAKIVMYNENGDVIEDDALILSATEISFSASIGATKTVPVKYAGISGKPANGYMVMSVTMSIPEVELTGDAELLNSISNIMIPADKLNIEDAKEDKTFVIYIKDVLDGSVEASVSELYVTVKIATSDSKHMTVDTGNIRLMNTEKNYNAVFASTEPVSVVVMGSAENIDNLTVDKLGAYLDLTGLKEGEHKVLLQFKLSAGYTIKEQLYVDIVITPVQN